MFVSRFALAVGLSNIQVSNIKYAVCAPNMSIYMYIISMYIMYIYTCVYIYIYIFMCIIYVGYSLLQGGNRNCFRACFAHLSVATFWPFAPYMSAHVACTFQFMLLLLHTKKHAKLAHEQKYKNGNMQGQFRIGRRQEIQQFAKTCKHEPEGKRGNNNFTNTCESKNPNDS